MNLIHAIRRPAGILLWLASVVLASLTAAMPAALAAPRPRPPGWNKHLPAHPHRPATGVIPGWQLTLMAVTVVLLAAVLVTIAYPGPGRRRRLNAPVASAMTTNRATPIRTTSLPRWPHRPPPARTTCPVPGRE